jgi:ureidoglycolate hydrolase
LRVIHIQVMNMQKAIEGSLPEHLVEIGESFEQKYQPVLDFDGWRVAMLRHGDATDRRLFLRIERHNETHEVFILTEGKAYLIIAENAEKPSEFYLTPMRRNTAYNVKPGVWHHAILSVNAHIILFEKTGTSRDNSDYHQLDEITINELQEKITGL